MRVTEALEEIDGVTDVEVSLEKNEATFQEEKPVDHETVKRKVWEAGYEVVE
jgi:copper chaperone CopZ